MRTKCMAIAAMTIMIAVACVSHAQMNVIVLNAENRDAKVVSGAKDFVGVWHGEYRNLPWVTVTIAQDGGTLSGAILFYLHRKTPGTAETATPGIPEPMLNPQFEGKTLTFRVSARHAHPPETLDNLPIVMMMEFIDRDHTRLINKDDPHLTGLLTRIWR